MRTGRPKKSPEKGRRKLVGLWLTESEFAELERAAGTQPRGPVAREFMLRAMRSSLVEKRA